MACFICNNPETATTYLCNNCVAEINAARAELAADGEATLVQDVKEDDNFFTCGNPDCLVCAY